MRPLVKAAARSKAADLSSSLRARTAAAARHGAPTRHLSRGLPASAALQAYPLPDVPLLMNDMHDAIKPFYAPSKLNDYKSAVSSLLWTSNKEQQSAVSQAIQGAVQSLDNSENWSHVWFSDLLLASRLPLSNMVKVAVKLQIPDQQWSQADSAAKLLRAVAIWHCDPSFDPELGAPALTDSQRLVTWQMEGLRGFRLPAKGKDELRAGGAGTFAVVWRKGRPFRVELRCYMGVLDTSAIREQVAQILAWEPTGEEEGIPDLANWSWRLGRDEWADTLASLRTSPRNEKPLSWIYDSAITMALEDYEAPPTLAGFLDDARMGATSENRFADQMLGSVVYPDGQVGLTFDHTPSDGAGIVEVSRLLANLLETQENYPSAIPSIQPPSPRPINVRNPSSDSVHPAIPEKHEEMVKRSVTSFDLTAPTEIHQKCRDSRLMDAILNWTYQAALQDIFGGWIGPVFQPVHQRKYVRGRTNLLQAVSEETLQLIRLVNEDEWVSDRAIADAFAAALASRRAKIEMARDGRAQGFFRQAGIHPILEQLAATPKALSPEESQAVNVVLEFFRQQSPFAADPDNDLSPGLQFSGFSLDGSSCDEAIEGVQGNIFLPKQFVLTYLDRPGGRVNITINATGERIAMLEPLEKALQKAFGNVMKAAEKYMRVTAETSGIPMLESIMH